MFADQNRPFTTLPTVLLTTASVVIIWTTVRNYVGKKSSFSQIDTFRYLFDLVAAHLSLGVGLFVLDIGHDIISGKTDIHPTPVLLGYLYHLLKILESTGVVISAASGITASKYSAFVSLFMPYWTFYRVVNRPSGSTDWRMQAIIDCLGRFLVFFMPFLIGDPVVEEAMVTMCEEFRFYPDIAIFGFWAFFTAKGERESKKAVEIFGKPYDDETIARIIGLAIVIHATYLKRQEENLKTQKAKDAQDKKATQEKQDQPAETAVKSRQRSQKKRG